MATTTNLTRNEVAKQIKRIPAHTTEKLNNSGLLWAAAEYEKYNVVDLISQAEIIMDADQLEKYKAHLASFEAPPHKTSSWTTDKKMWK